MGSTVRSSLRPCSKYVFGFLVLYYIVGEMSIYEASFELQGQRVSNYEHIYINTWLVEKFIEQTIMIF